ncbi:MAG: c-type cytochrome [Actinomycetota bacterium]
MPDIAIATLILGFIVLIVIVISRRGPQQRLHPVPPALRPGDPDDVLESERLTSIMRWGVALSVFLAGFLFVYMITDPGRRDAKAEKFRDQSLERGAKYFALRTDPVTGEENLSGIECARCHGIGAVGGENEFLNPATGKKTTVKVPELETVFARYEKPPLGFKNARAFIYETIERGRPGTDMPTWGNKFGGPLTEQQLDDIVNYIEDIQKPIEVESGATGDKVFAQFCSACHGQGGAGGSGPSMLGGSEAAQFPNIDDHIAFVKSGSTKGTAYGTKGVGTGAMPAWGEILTDEQIRLVIEYERSL